MSNSALPEGQPSGKVKKNDTHFNFKEEAA